eukprot:Sdes_comp19213_c0_seq1m10093
MSSSHVVESEFHGVLPYIDQDLNYPGYKEYVNHLLDEEMKHFPFSKTYRDKVSRLVGAPLALSSLPKKNQDGRYLQDCIDLSRYQVPNFEPASAGNVENLKKMVETMKVICENENTRLSNLELLEKYGASKWKKHIQNLLKLKDEYSELEQEIANDTNHVNMERKRIQNKCGSELSTLESQFYRLVYENYQLELACNSPLANDEDSHSGIPS